MNEKIFKEINKILINWNPIEVDRPAVTDEYTALIPRINSIKNNKYKLLDFLTSSLLSFGLDYDDKNIEQKNEVQNVVTEIQKLFR